MGTEERLTADERVLSAAHLAQSPANAAVRWLIHITEDIHSARSPGWFEAWCDCEWYTNGSEPVVEDAAHDHVRDAHAPFVAFLTNELANAVRYGKPIAGATQ